MPDKKVCVILGAGASHDVRGLGTHTINKGYQPPLTSQLFNIDNELYSEIIRNYPGAEYLANMLAEYAVSGERSIEDYLRQYAEHSNITISTYFKHIPGYLRDLFWRASNNYVTMPSSYVRLVNGLIVEHPHQVLFLVLNYDTLLERALERYGQFEYNNITQYINSDLPAKVIKLHGSINWLKLLGRVPETESPRNAWIKQVANLDIFQPVEEHEIEISHFSENICGYMGKEPRERRLYYPIMTAPLAGKDINKTVCPQSHIEAATEFLKDCFKFLIIGTSGLDEDLKDFLQTSVNHTRNPDPEVVIVDYDSPSKPNATDNVARQFGESIFADVYILKEIKLYNKGFRKFLASQEFQQFIKLP